MCLSRNLALIRRLDEQPLVWILLELIATGRLPYSCSISILSNTYFSLDSNAFQLCLPIVRCLLSALIVQWENLRGDDRAKNYSKQLNLSTNLIILLKKVTTTLFTRTTRKISFVFFKARYLPSPLNEIYELFSLVTAYDCFTLLSNVWNYLKQNQQLLITRPVTLVNVLRDPLYSDPIRFVVQKNIADVGPLAEHFLHLQLQPAASLS
jgi:hypothetical protein